MTQKAQETLSAMPTQVEDIRFLTANFHKMQGLRWVPIGVWLALKGLEYYGVLDWEALIGANMFTPMLIVILVMVAYGFIGLHYESTYGEVIPPKDKGFKKWIVPLFYLLILAQIVVTGIYNLPIDLPLIYAGGYILHKSLTGVRNYGLTVLSGALFYLATAPLWTSSMPPMAPVFVACGVSLVLSGIYLHVKFLRSFRTIRQNMAGHV